MKRYTVRALAALKGEKSHVNLGKSFARHGIKPDENGKYTEADYARQKEMGQAMDKSKLSARLAEAGREAEGKPLQSPATLTYMKLQRQVKKLDIEIQMSQVDLDTALGKNVPLETHKQEIQAVAALMLSWWEKASENAATKIKDETVLNALREAGDRARLEILEHQLA